MLFPQKCICYSFQLSSPDSKRGFVALSKHVILLSTTFLSTEYSSSKKSGILASQILNATNNIDDGEMNFVLMNLISRFLFMDGQMWCDFSKNFLFHDVFVIILHFDLTNFAQGCQVSKTENAILAFFENGAYKNAKCSCSIRSNFIS